MNAEKYFLRNKFIEFQLKIADMNHALSEQRDAFDDKEQKLFLSLLEILDAFESIEETVEVKKDQFDKTAFMLSKNIRSIHKKLNRLIKSSHIVQIEFPDNKARMDHCKIIDTHPQPEMENETILSVVKNGYINQQDGSVLRKAEVITVSNEALPA